MGRNHSAQDIVADGLRDGSAVEGAQRVGRVLVWEVTLARENVGGGHELCRMRRF